VNGRESSREGAAALLAFHARACRVLAAAARAARGLALPDLPRKELGRAARDERSHVDLGEAQLGREREVLERAVPPPQLLALRRGLQLHHRPRNRVR